MGMTRIPPSSRSGVVAVERPDAVADAEGAPAPRDHPWGGLRPPSEGAGATSATPGMAARHLHHA